jgi:hypothetical protein
MYFTEKEWRQIIASPFNVELMQGDNISINGQSVSKAVWNLMLSIRDVSLYSKGIKPHRNWKITDVKKYFGLSGNTEKVVESINELHKIVLGDK